MKRKRPTPEQVVKHLREADQLLGQGKTVAQVCKRLGVTEVTYYRWRRGLGRHARPSAACDESGAMRRGCELQLRRCRAGTHASGAGG